MLGRTIRCTADTPVETDARNACSSRHQWKSRISLICLDAPTRQTASYPTPLQRKSPDSEQACHHCMTVCSRYTECAVRLGSMTVRMHAPLSDCSTSPEARKPQFEQGLGTTFSMRRQYLKSSLLFNRSRFSFATATRSSIRSIARRRKLFKNHIQ